MKTVFITTSPKKKWSNSSYLLTITKWFTKGEKTWIAFQGPKDYEAILNALQYADNIVLATPVYVDAVPSHVLLLLEKIQQYAEEKHLHFKVYALCNCGFYEGIQCELALAVLQCWCERAGLHFCGGVGIGAGEMIGALRLSPIIGIFAVLIECFVGFFMLLKNNMFSVQALFDSLHISVAVISTMVFLLFSIGPWIGAAKMGKSVSHQSVHSMGYCTVSFCPAFLFVFFASIYWIVRSFFMHFLPPWKLFHKIKRL